MIVRHGRFFALIAAAVVTLSLGITPACPAQATLRDATLTELPQFGSDTALVTSDRPWTAMQTAYNEARFGLFLHWGLYSQAGGEWRGRRFYGISEWMEHQLRIPTKDYAALAAQFDPIDFDARRWVDIAKQSGVRYIVVTAKHHDGFAMYDSKVSSYNIVAATPFKRDPLKELVDAAHAAGIKIGFYYSQTQDWHELNAVGNDWDFPKEGRDFKKYYYEKAIPQIKELLTRYGHIDMIWFDTPMNISAAEAKGLYDLVKTLQPNCLVNSRLGQGLGDFQVFADGELPSHSSASVPWEAIFTHNDSWGYRRLDSNFKSTTELLRLLVAAASHGGNLMLNIGPDGKGDFPPSSIERFEALGAWLKVNGESIYGTSASPLGPVPWGAVTQRPGKLYLHILRAPSDGRVLVPDVEAKVSSAHFLADGKAVAFTREGKDVWLALDHRPDARDSVVVLAYDGKLLPSTQRSLIVQRSYGRTVISPSNSLDSPGIKHVSYTHSTYFGEWRHIETLSGLTSPDVAAEWSLRVIDPGDYRVSIQYMSSGKQAGREGWIEGAGKPIRFQVLQTSEGYSPMRPAAVFEQNVGLAHFDKEGNYTLRLRPDTSGPDIFLLQDIVLTPDD